MEGPDIQQSLMNENAMLKEEIKTLKIKLEVYKDVIKMQGLKVSQSEDEDELYNFDPTKYLESIDVDVADEHLIEEIAALRTSDDLVSTITIDNAFEAFFHNEKNHLPLLKDYLEMIENPMHIGDLIIEKVLNECSFKYDKCKKTYKLYKDGWLKPSRSAELLEELILNVSVNIKCYNKLWKYYYGYDSRSREMNKSKWADLNYKISEINKLTKFDKSKVIEYICNKML